MDAAARACPIAWDGRVFRAFLGITDGLDFLRLMLRDWLVKSKDVAAPVRPAMEEEP